MNSVGQMRLSLRCLGILSMAVLLRSAGWAQNPFEDAVKQLSSDNVRGYLQPFVNAMGANLNSGLYRSASISEGGVSVKLDFVGMGTFIGDNEKGYSGVPPQPFSQTPVTTATVYGDKGTIVTDPSGISYQFQNGQVKTSFVPFAAPQLTVGNLFGSQAIVRYVPIPEVGDFPKVTLFGIGGRHSISRYLPDLPVDLAAGLFYQSFDVGDIISAKTFNIGAQASKSFSVLTLYGGLQWETSSMDLSYAYTGPGSTPSTKVTLSMDGENNIRAMAGLGLSLAILNINADINVGKVVVASGGIGFGF